MEKNRKLIPYPFYWDDVPIDISFVFGDEKPAGKHGFLKIDGEEFRFEDGTPVRFWGTNFNSGLNFPPFDFSEKIAKRLSKIGVNLVRFHQMDAEWSTPNIFQFSKGKNIGNTRDFDRESMDRLDYLIHCLKREGIYMYMDMLTYRRFKTGDGAVAPEKLQDAARPYSLFDPKLIGLQKEFNENLWNHFNPYTKLCYKDDPAICMTEIINEGDMFSRPVTIPYYKDMLDEMFFTWLKENNREKPQVKIEYPSKDKSITDFLIYIQEKYFREMYDHLRDLGVKIPISGTNWAINTANRKTQKVCDFDDGHVYWYQWKWKEGKKEFSNDSMAKSENTFFESLAFQKNSGRPYFISEWDMPWPNEYRAESPVWLAAVSSFQNWMGCAIHTYSYSSMKDIKVTGKEVSSEAIGSVPYREGVFNTWNDPAKFGLFYHCALITRRSDIKKAGESYTIDIRDMNLLPGDIPVLLGAAETHKISLSFDREFNGEKPVDINNNIRKDKDGEIFSDTGQLFRDYKSGRGWINSEKTKGIYGFHGGEKIDLGPVSIRCHTDFATVVMSSLSCESIASSGNILLTAVGRSQNTAMEFNREHNIMVKLGREPILVETIKVDIEIKTDIKTLKVWSVNGEGFYGGVIPSVYEDNTFKFSLGNEFNSMYYLIMAE